MVSVSAVILNIAQCEGAGGDRKSHGGCLSTDLVILDTGTLLRPSVVLRVCEEAEIGLHTPALEEIARISLVDWSTLLFLDRRV
ncbi:hypothetical protein AcV5_004982 [Taiwanofungus camphoratus]|nr:hypothetical protein AcV5_004982 [Antrodia cinnamomea]